MKRDLERRVDQLEREHGQATEHAPTDGPLIVAVRRAGDTPADALFRAVGPGGPPAGATVVYIMRDFPDDDAPEIAELWRQE